MEFFFPPVGDSGDIWYDVSLVDGYSLPAEIIPSVQQGSCVTTDCHISLAACPQNEDFVGDLRLVRNGRTIKCLAPCKSKSISMQQQEKDNNESFNFTKNGITHTHTVSDLTN